MCTCDHALWSFLGVHWKKKPSLAAYLQLTTHLETNSVRVCAYMSKVENDEAKRGLCYISVPSQLIALAPATSPRLHKEIHYANDSLSY